jgi:benzoyl-CoA reductase/2-hydroxyglutaryl-CoA dehydratase subunit BcrC/BadD/HgdB
MAAEGCVAMWKDLGLDLKAHDDLLSVLGKAYGDLYTSRKGRPAGMTYLDYVMSEIHGLRISELQKAKKQGRKVVGSFCLYVPEEIVLAAGGVSIGLCAGADIGTAAAEQVLPRNTCALIKSFVGFKLAKLCPYMESCDLVIGETTCDGKKKAYETFGTLHPLFVLEVPHMKTPAGRRLFRSEIDRLVAKIGSLSGRTISAESLRGAVKTVNAKRKAIARINAARAAEPAPIAGLDALLVSQVQFYDDPARFTAKMNALADELEARVKAGTGAAPAGAPRILVSGCPMAVPNWKVPYVVEASGAVIVGEESCVGERGTGGLVLEDGATREAILDRIADRYLDIHCAVFTPNDERIADIVRMARRTKADGVLHYVLQFCTPYAMEAGRVAKALEQEDLPLLRIETDYGMEDMPQLKTRIQAFLEILRDRRKEAKA